MFVCVIAALRFPPAFEDASAVCIPEKMSGAICMVPLALAFWAASGAGCGVGAGWGVGAADELAPRSNPENMSAQLSRAPTSEAFSLFYLYSKHNSPTPAPQAHTIKKASVYEYYHRSPRHSTSCHPQQIKDLRRDWKALGKRMVVLSWPHCRYY